MFTSAYDGGAGNSGLLAAVTDKVLGGALRAARQHALDIDQALKPASQAVEAIEQQMNRPETEAALRADFLAARLSFSGRRYDAEARSNQVIASL